MTFKVFVAGLHSLRVSTPGLIFLGVAVLLVVLPRRFSAAAGTGAAMAASAAALLAMIVASTPALPEQTDLVKDRLSLLGPAWLAVVIPIVVSCFQRSTSIHRGIAVAGAHLSAGALCFAMAARTPSLLLLSLTLAMIGATTIPLGAESETRGSRLAGRWALFSAMMWALFFIGLSMATRAPVAGVQEAQPAVYRSTHLVGSVVATIALFGLLGWGPTSRWMQGGSIGVRLATSTVYAMIATISYLKLFPVIHIESVMTVVWAWSMASLLYHLGSLRTTRLDDFASSALAFWTSVATGMLVTAHGEARNEVVVGSISLLIFVSVLGPALGAVIDACTLNLNGDLGNPFGQRSVALKSSLYLLAGLPLSLGFWGLKLLTTDAMTPGETAGMRQATMGLALVGALTIGFGILRHLSSLAGRPSLPPIDDDCRWQAASTLGGVLILMAIGCWPGPLFTILHEIVQMAASVLPDGPLKP